MRDALSECEARCSVLEDRLRTIDEEKEAERARAAEEERLLASHGGWKECKEEEPLPPFSIDDPVCVCVCVCDCVVVVCTMGGRRPPVLWVCEGGEGGGEECCLTLELDRGLTGWRGGGGGGGGVGTPGPTPR